MASAQKVHGPDFVRACVSRPASLSAMILDAVTPNPRRSCRHGHGSLSAKNFFAVAATSMVLLRLLKLAGDRLA
jgi:hypothetical protein